MAVLARKGGKKKRATFPSGGPPLEKETNGHFIHPKICLNKNAWNRNTVNRKTVNEKTMNNKQRNRKQ
jgi:hypothetical protein